LDYIFDKLALNQVDTGFEYKDFVISLHPLAGDWAYLAYFIYKKAKTDRSRAKNFAKNLHSEMGTESNNFKDELKNFFKTGGTYVDLDLETFFD
jgi:hypothetical protein